MFSPFDNIVTFKKHLLLFDRVQCTCHNIAISTSENAPLKQWLLASHKQTSEVAINNLMAPKLCKLNLIDPLTKKWHPDS